MRAAIGLAAVLVLATAVGCAGHGPVVDTGSKPPGVGGTISGMVRASGGTVALAGRTVTAVDVATGARFETSTAVNGGYTMKVPTGKYRLEVELRPGETLAEQPAETEVNTSDLDPHRNFTITVKPLA
jgi:hypothetical protein